MNAVVRLEDIPPGSSKRVTMDGKEVALFNVEGRLYAVGNRCPHRSGPLARGQVEKVPDPAGGVETLAIRCPIHGWLFELSTGRCLTRTSASTPSYPVSCDGDQVCLGLPQGESSGPSVSGTS